MKRFRYFLEYLLASAAIKTLRALGYHNAMKFADFIGNAMFVLVRRRRRLAVANVSAAGFSDAEAIARASFRHFARVVAGTICATGKEEATFVMSAATRKLLEEEKTRGVILVSGHVGSWEYGAIGMTRFRPVLGVARKMNNPRVQELLSRNNMREGFRTVEKHSAKPLQLVRALRNGEILALLTDQHAHGDHVAEVPFFGRGAKTYTTPAVLHKLTGAPIIFGAPFIAGEGKYEVEISEPLEYGKDADEVAITADLAKRLEDAIRKHPEQYLWMHRRWR